MTDTHDPTTDRDDLRARLARDPLAGKLLIPAKDAVTILGLSRSMVYALMDAGELQTVSFGRRRMIVAQSLADMVDRRIAEAA